jgi:hypothetical protein
MSTRLLALLALAASVLGLSVAAQAAPVKAHKHVVVVTGGSVAISPSSATAKFITSHNITVTPIAPATLASGQVTLPVAGGLATNRKLTGVLVLRGGVRFASTSKTVNLRRLVVVRTHGVTRLAGRVNKRFMVLARLSKLTLTVSDKTATVTGEIHLTAAAAKAIDHLFGTKVVKRGYDLGSFTATLNLE